MSSRAPARLGAAVGAAVGAALLPFALAGCGDDEPAAAYCEAVVDRQRELSEIVGAGGPTALLEALEIFRALAAEAPDDLRDEWSLVVRRIEVLQTALDDAGVDPATYDPEQPPAGVDEEEQAAIAAAARELARPQTAAAVDGIEQQARDVCGTQLTL